MKTSLAVRVAVAMALVLQAGCDALSRSGRLSSVATKHQQKSLSDARKGFVTKIVNSVEPGGPPDAPSGNEFQLIQYPSPVGPLAAYITPDPGDGQKRPAVVWITGGDNNSIGDVWTPSNRSNDQSASAFRQAGIVLMFPSQRGGNNNPGQREGFFGEVDDVLAATDYLAQLPYVDRTQIYLGGHSTGATLVMLVAACTDRYRAVFAFGPVARVDQYGGEYVYCDLNNDEEVVLRSPIFWLHSVQSPMYVIEGGENGNWQAIQEMAEANKNSRIKFFRVPGHDHFTVLAPATEKLAQQINTGQLNITEQTFDGMH